MTESPSTTSPIEYKLATHGNQAGVNHAGKIVPFQRAFTIETYHEGTTQTILEGLLDHAIDLEGTAGNYAISLHLEKIGAHCTITIDGIKAPEVRHLRLRQTYDMDLLVSFEAEINGVLIDYHGPLVVISATNSADPTTYVDLEP